MRTKQLLALLLCSGTFLLSCQQSSLDDTQPKPKSILDKLKNAGFSSENVRTISKDTFLVEGDIEMTSNQIDSLVASNTGAKTEHYRTTYLVQYLPRVITVKLATTLPQFVFAGTDEMIKRYNALGLKITFKRITSGTPTINIVKDESLLSGTFATSGFPYSYGSPYGYLKIKPSEFTSRGVENVPVVASIITHEMGHAIGLRHTDMYAKCFTTATEQAGTAGAILIPNSPTTDNFSFMRSCSYLMDEPFTDSDIAALQTLYGK